MILQFLIKLFPFCLPIFLQLIGWKMAAFIGFIIIIVFDGLLMLYYVWSFLTAWKDEWANGMTRAVTDGAITFFCIGIKIFLSYTFGII